MSQVSKLTEVKILNEQGAKARGKPKGTYLTLEADQLSKADDEYHSEIYGGNWQGRSGSLWGK